VYKHPRFELSVRCPVSGKYVICFCVIFMLFSPRALPIIIDGGTQDKKRVLFLMQGEQKRIHVKEKVGVDKGA